MTIDHQHSAQLQAELMKAIVGCSVAEVNGVTIAHIHTPEVLDAFSMVMSGLIATSPEARTDEGLKRVLRRFARQLERRVVEFKAHTKIHGSPFTLGDPRNATLG